VFVFDDGRPLVYSIVQITVQRLLKQVGIKPEPGKPHPMLLSLRHTFAVRALEAAPTDKAQLEHHLWTLATYLGHAHYSSTYWYLEKTPLILAQISDAAEDAFYRGDL
jgi:integrase